MQAKSPSPTVDRSSPEEPLALTPVLLDMVSHDLRNPLNAILLSTDSILRNGDFPRELEPRLKRIHDGAERAMRLLRDLLDLSEVRRFGGITIKRTTADLHAAADVATDEVRSVFPHRTVVRERCGPASGQWDVDRVVQVGVNLISNALKYSPDGTAVDVRTGGDEQWAYIEVHNQGEPIPSGRLRNLFSPRQGGSAAEAHRPHGLGLGLFIVDQLVRSHQGAIAVESTPERGTNVLVRFPRNYLWA
jgi:signal transduction histidine kinase